MKTLCLSAQLNIFVVYLSKLNAHEKLQDEHNSRRYRKRCHERCAH